MQSIPVKPHQRNFQGFIDAFLDDGAVDFILLEVTMGGITSPLMINYKRPGWLMKKLGLKNTAYLSLNGQTVADEVAEVWFNAHITDHSIVSINTIGNGGSGRVNLYNDSHDHFRGYWVAKSVPKKREVWLTKPDPRTIGKDGRIDIDLAEKLVDEGGADINMIRDFVRRGRELDQHPGRDHLNCRNTPVRVTEEVGEKVDEGLSGPSYDEFRAAMERSIFFGAKNIHDAVADIYKRPSQELQAVIDHAHEKIMRSIMGTHWDKNSVEEFKVPDEMRAAVEHAREMMRAEMGPSPKKPDVPKPVRTFPIELVPGIIQYHYEIFVWFDEAGLIGGAEASLESAKAERNRYMKELMYPSQKPFELSLENFSVVIHDGIEPTKGDLVFIASEINRFAGEYTVE